MKKSNQVPKSWGYFKILLQGKGYWVKKLKINGETSLQTHKKREELWLVYIPSGVKHKLSGRGEITEIAWGEPEEKDIRRYENSISPK